MGFSGNRDGSQGWSPPVIRSGSRRGKPNCNPFACGAALSVMPRQNQGWQPRRQPLAPTTPRLPFKFVGWCQAPAPTLLGCRPPRPSCGLAQCQDDHAGPPRASAHPLLRHVAVVPSADQAKVLLPVLVVLLWRNRSKFVEFCRRVCAHCASDDCSFGGERGVATGPPP